MKKLVTSLFFMLSISLVLFSQEETDSTIKNTNHQIGFNIGSLVKALTNKDDLPMFQETFTYKYIKNNSALRVGLGGVYQNIVSDDNFNSGSDIDQTILTVRIGYEKQKDVSKKWQYYYGWDLKFSNSDLKNESLFSSNSRIKSKTFAVSPLLGFQFRLMPSVFLQTEASLDFYYSESDFTNLDDIFFPTTFDSQSNSSKAKGVNLTLPNILLLVVEF